MFETRRPNPIAACGLGVALCMALLAGCGSTGGSASPAAAAASAPTVIPATPMGLSATPGNQQAMLAWSASTGAASYSVKRSTTSGGPYSQVATAPSTSYTDATVSNGSTYYYVVSAVNDSGQSADSAQASVTPAAATSTPAAGAPAAPTGLAANAGDAQVNLTWSASSGATSYNVQRSTTNGGPYSQITTATSPAYTDKTVSDGTTYYYVVAAVNSSGTSANSTQAVANPLAPPAQVVRGCNGLSAVGVWDHITPAGADLSTFGLTAVTLVPNDPATVYVGTSNSGLFKSTDCGANFVKVNTGTLGTQLSAGSMHALIDPIQPNIIYSYSLYGQNGFFKSTDGGVNFQSILTPQIVAAAPYGGFVSGYDMDPQNHLHLLITWHQECAAPYTKACYAETLDGGVTWTMRNGDASWAGGEGTFLAFLDSDRWLFSSASNGLWLSKDRGATWAQVPMAQVAHGSGQLVRMSDGSFFMAAANGILHSSDGETWNLIPNSGSLDMGLATDGTTLWASEAFPYNPNQRPTPAQHYWQASVANPTAWTRMSGAPSLSSGGTWLSYDPDHHILYSANYWDGLWRVVVQ